MKGEYTMPENTVCPKCDERARQHIKLSSEKGNARCKMLGDVSIIKDFYLDSTTKWRRSDTLIASVVPSDGAYEGDRVWHVRVVNVTKRTGLRHAALCRLPRKCIQVVPRSGEKKIELSSRPEPPFAKVACDPSWKKFIPEESGGEGHWTKDLPTRPGLYPIRGFSPSTHLITIRVTSDRGQCAYLDTQDREVDPQILKKICWIWSEPLPQMPSLSTEVPQ